MSDEIDAKDNNNDRYVAETDDVGQALERFDISVYADLVPHQRIRKVHANIEGSVRVDNGVLRTRQHL